MTDQHASIAPLVATLASTTLDTPRIYVACLAAYNNGRLHGRWIDATDPHKVWEQVNAMLAASPEPLQRSVLGLQRVVCDFYFKKYKYICRGGRKYF